MSLMGSVILSVCLGSSGQYHDACTHAIDAGEKQTGADKQFEAYDKHWEYQANQWADENLGDNKNLIGGFLYVAKAAADRKLDVPLPSLGVCDKFVSEVTPSTAMLIMRWHF